MCFLSMPLVAEKNIGGRNRQGIGGDSWAEQVATTTVFRQNAVAQAHSTPPHNAVRSMRMQLGMNISIHIQNVW